MIPALKEIIARYGEDPGFATVRPPLAPLSEAERLRLFDGLAARGFAMPGLSEQLRSAAKAS